MKKQILFLTFFVAALFAGTNAFAQYITEPTALPSCITAETLTNCTANALNPVQGETYDYTIATTAATDVVRWFVINNTTMEAANDSLVSITSGVVATDNAHISASDGTDAYLLSVESGTYNSGVTANNTIELTWKYFDGISEEILLVAWVVDGDGCTNNLAVYRIIPEPGFTLDIASIKPDGSNPQKPTALGGTPNEDCVSPIESAVYDGGSTTPDGTLTVDYGENWAFFVVNATNFFDSWLPQLEINYDLAAPAVVEAQWTYLSDATSTNWYNFSGALGGTWTTTSPVIAGATYATAGTAGFNVGDNNLPATTGECIVVRVRLDWGTAVEHDQSDGTLTVAVNGVAWDGVGTDVTDLYDNATEFEDLHYADCGTDGFTNDVVSYLITPRPQVEENTDPQQEIKTGEGVD